MIYLQLFITFLQIGMFSFGGGYAVMPMIQRYIVEQRGWITFHQLADITSISQMTPGPIAINAATFVGVKVAGPLGGVVATIGSITPSFILLILLAYFFFRNSNLYYIQDILKGLRPAIVSLILIAAISLGGSAIFLETDFTIPWLQNLNYPAIVSGFVAFFLLIKYKVDSVIVIFSGALIGIIYHAITII